MQIPVLAPGTGGGWAAGSTRICPAACGFSGQLHGRLALLMGAVEQRLHELGMAHGTERTTRRSVGISFDRVTCRRNALAIGAAILGAGSRATAQTTRVHRIGVLTPGEPQWDRAVFLAALRDLGYVEGQDIVLEVRSADGDLHRLPELAAPLVAGRPDMLIGVNSPGTQELFTRKGDLPLVAGNVGDPIGLGIVSNLSRPDRGVTGVTNLSVDLTVKRLNLLAQAVPGLRRVALFLHPDDPVVAPQLEALAGAATGLHLELFPYPMRSEEDLRSALGDAAQRSIRAILRLAGQAQSIGPMTGRLATERGLPSMLLDRASVTAGGLMAYFAHYGALWETLARQTDKILRGASVGEIPFETPTRFEFVLSLEAARLLDLSLPLDFVAQADEVLD